MGHALKRSPGINRKSRVSYPGPEFLSSATWPSLPKKHYNGLNPNPIFFQTAARLWWNPTNFVKIGVLPLFFMELWVILCNFLPILKKSSI